MNRTGFRLWLGWLLGVLLLPAVLACPARVILLRHAEKPAEESDPDLSARGRQQADALAAWLTTNAVLTDRGLPAVLFASQVTDHGHGRRPRETLEPLAKKLGLPIQTPFRSENYHALARFVLESEECDGKVVVVCWVHEHLSKLAAALGVKPAPVAWKGGVYDQAWVLDWKNDRPRRRVVLQRLLPGDRER